MTGPYTLDDWGETFIAVERMKRTDLREYARRLEWFAADLLIKVPLEDIIAYRLALKEVPAEEGEET